MYFYVPNNDGTGNGKRAWAEPGGGFIDKKAIAPPSVWCFFASFLGFGFLARGSRGAGFVFRVWGFDGMGVIDGDGDWDWDGVFVCIIWYGVAAGG